MKTVYLLFGSRSLMLIARRFDLALSERKIDDENKETWKLR